MSKMYTGAGRVFQEIASLPIDEEGLADIRRRVKLQPHFLGEPLVVVAEAVDFPAIRQGDDDAMIAIDALGRCAAVSISMGVADIDRQTSTLRLAASLASLSAGEIGRIAKNFIDRPANDQLRRLWQEMDVEISDDSVELASLLAASFERDAEEFTPLLNNSQRMIIASEAFSPSLIGIIEWMNGYGVNSVGLRYRKFIVGGQDVFFAEQVAPKSDSAAPPPLAGKKTPSEASEAWRLKGRAYYAERLNPRLAATLDEMLAATAKSTFTVNWQNKYYFWIRGPRRNLRVRAYARDRLELGFHNSAPAAVAEFLEPYGLGGVEVVSIGGYSDSPFVVIVPEMRLDESWVAMLNDWLSGANPGKTRVISRRPGG